MKYSPTWISDNFPLDKLECQYWEICSEYVPDDCAFGSPCAVRWKLREFVEDYMAVEGLTTGIEGILDAHEK